MMLHHQLLISFTFFLFFLFISFGNTHHICDPKQSLALFEFKRAFSLNQSASNYSSCSDAYPKTATWNQTKDCCSWDGVQCDDQGEGRVVGLHLGCSWLEGILHPNSTLFALSHLQTLNLSHNSFLLSKFSPQFGSFKDLKLLDLSSSSFYGDVPLQISYLSNLVSLHLSSNHLTFSQLLMNQLLHNLTHLRDLALNDVQFINITSTTTFMNLSLSLASLSLSSSGLAGNFPQHVMSLPNLRVLQLDNNVFLKGYLPMSNWSQSLEILNLYSTKFSGQIPYSIGTAKSLRSLNLSSCNFTGPIPKSIGNLTQLTKIDLSSNNFTGQLPNVALDRLSNLNQLDLKANSLIGAIPSWIFALPRLNYLDLSNNHFSSFMKDFRSNSLEFLDLSSNNLQGGISESIYKQVNLTYLTLGSNNLSGVLDLDMFLRVQSRLISLDVSNNNQILVQYTNVRSMNNNLVWIEMGSCKLGKFPYFLRYQKKLEHLDLSNNQIEGEIPKWFSELGALNHLNLSHNFLSSGIMEILPSLPNLKYLYLDSNLFKQPFPMLPPSIKQLVASNNEFSGNIHPSICNATDLRVLDLSNNSLSGTVPSCLFNTSLELLELKRNNFSGSIPIPPPFILVYIVSENHFTGEIPSAICHARFLVVLSLSNNHFNGTIPPCLANMSFLSMLDLKNNHLSGTFPILFRPGSHLSTLEFNGNQIEGELSPSLLNCENLEVLDLGNNKITGVFPHWLEAASSLRVLILRSNRFYGQINNSMNTNSFPNLRIIDLSRNHFNGVLPSNLFKNMKAMKEVEDGDQIQKPKSISYNPDIISFYQGSVVVSLKGFDLELERILLIFKTIDFSSNNFSGEIPESIGTLMTLKGLNFSHNKLTGKIPITFGKLSNLEWLDLSSNKLWGKIPSQLAALTFLSVLNLSQNHLSGPIPQGKQFATFRSSSFAGNPGLCGFPLPNCDTENTHKSQLQDEENDSLEKGFWWKVVLMGYGCGMVLGISIGYIVLRVGRPLWIVARVERRLASIRKRSKRRNCWPKKRND